MASPYQSPMSFSPPVSGSDVTAGGATTTAAAAAGMSVLELPQSQVDAIIRTKRKAREPKACYPCHARKVKCDRKLPCDGCVKRDHADLCSYERPSKKRIITTGSPAFLESPATAGSAGAGVPEQQIGATGPDGHHVHIKSEVGGGGGPSSRPNAPAGPGPGRVSIPREEWENVCKRLKEMEKTIANLRVGLEKAEDGGGGGGGGSGGGGVHASVSALETGSVQSAGEGSRSKVGSSPDREGIHAANTLGEGTVHLGSRSVLAYILNNKSGSDQLQALLEGGILPKLGLDNESATYPFVDLWSSDMSSFDISAVCSALPSDQQCKEFFFYYRDIAGAIYPVMPDLSKFEMNLDLLLQNRASTGGVYRADNDQAQRPFGVTLAYLGLLFAVFASGCQSSDLPCKERELTSQVYVCCSYQCLRMTNFLSQPSIEAIQTLLVIGNVLSYNMNPGVSYVLLGMTLRMGLALGLHVESSRFLPMERYRRRFVWWSMAWQDSHFSLSYDRPSTTAVSQPNIAYRPDSQPGERSYFETLTRIISLALEVVRGRMLSHHSQLTFKAIQGYNQSIQQIMTEAKPHLRNRKYCLTATEHLERVVLRLHASYFSSELCRPALKPTADINDPTVKRMRGDCVVNLMVTVETYIEMHTISSHASRSWITMQRAISSAFLLAVIEESKLDPRICALLRQLEGIIAERASAERLFEPNEAAAAAAGGGGGTVPQGLDSSTNVPTTTPTSSGISPSAINATSPVPASATIDPQAQWAKPLTKTLRALQKLNAAFSNQGMRPAGASGASSTLVPAPPTSAGSPAAGMGARVVQSGMTPTLGSLPPPTPESSSSGEWTMPNLIDRAAEYIHPPLWG